MNAPNPIVKPHKGKKRRSARAWWFKQLHTWHWISAAISMVGMLVFAVTGITLNHADIIAAKPSVVDKSGTLPPSLLRMLKAAPATSDAALPPPVARAVSQSVGLDPSGRAGEWSDDEVYVAMPRPGGDAWVSVNRTTGAIQSETTYQGVIALLNDLHKGRNTGFAWRLFIDVFAGAAIVFTLTGLLLLQLHAKNRKSTWPLVAAGFAVPLILFLVFIH